jgi:glycogen synthase
VRAVLEAAAGTRIPERAFVVLVPSRFIPVKGHAVLLDALQRLHNRTNLRPWVFGFGFGSLRDSLQQQALASGLKHVFFREPLRFEQLIGVMAHSNLVLLPSLREAFGLAAAEAMAVGTPMLVTNADGLKEIVGDADCALVAEAGSADDLAEKLAEAMQDAKGLRRRRDIASTRVREHFDISVCAANWARVLRHAAGRSA